LFVLGAFQIRSALGRNKAAGEKVVPESIAMGNYNMDSHNVQR
jgi:hypothetical protein